MNGRGFTLLEVMVAMAILAGSLTLLLESQTQSVRSSNRAKMTTTATLLARAKLADLEDELYREGFSDIGSEASGDFSDEGFANFRWEWKIETVELPSAADAQQAAGAAAQGGGAEARPTAPGSAMVAASGSEAADAASAMVGAEFELIRGVLEASVRRGTFTIYWKEGASEQSFTVQSYFTDPSRIEMAMGLAPAP